jgi:uncharacterized protein (DUF4415 family)
MSKTSDQRPTIVMPSVDEDKVIRAAAMVPAAKALRGRPKSDNKKLLVSVRYSPEVVSYFKATGEGWQARMDGVLLDYVARHPR